MCNQGYHYDDFFDDVDDDDGGVNADDEPGDKDVDSEGDIDETEDEDEDQKEYVLCLSLFLLTRVFYVHFSRFYFPIPSIFSSAKKISFLIHIIVLSANAFISG